MQPSALPRRPIILNHRSTEKELIDLGPNYYTTDEYRQCLKMLFRINQLLGIFSDTKKTLNRFPENSSLLDIGCGGGLFLLHLSKYFPDMTLTGIDISPIAIETAQQELLQWEKNSSSKNVSFKIQPQLKLELAENSIDIILSTLVCHHITDKDLIEFLLSTLKITRKAVIIHDLHRHPIAHWIYRWISPLLFRNRLITHDGLISIRRGFTKAELLSLLKNAGINSYSIKWCFPFRWRVIIWKN